MPLAKSVAHLVKCADWPNVPYIDVTAVSHQKQDRNIFAARCYASAALDIMRCPSVNHVRMFFKILFSKFFTIR